MVKELLVPSLQIQLKYSFRFALFWCTNRPKRPAPTTLRLDTTSDLKNSGVIFLVPTLYPRF